MSEEIKKGLLGIVVDETTISHVVPELSALTYRGYKVQDLCDKCDFEEVAFVVLHGELPSKIQLKKFSENDSFVLGDIIFFLFLALKYAATAVGVFANILIAFLMLALGELSRVSLSSKAIKLTQVLITSIGCAFLGIC